MTPTELLESLAAHGIEVRANGANLKVIAPGGTISDAMREQLRLHKAALLAALADPDTGAEDGATLRQGRHPLSFAQRRLWFLQQLEGGHLYNVGGSFSLRGMLDREALQAALNAVIARHAILRTVYAEENGEPYQYLRADSQLQLDHFVLEGDAQAREAQWQRISTEYADRSFQLDRDLMLRVGVVEYGQDEHRVMIQMHHIASDGWSLSIFTRELNHFYRICSEGAIDAVATLPPLPIQYADHARRQTAAFNDGKMAQSCDFWCNYLKDLPEVHGLPLDTPRPKEQSYRGATVTSRVPTSVSGQLMKLAREQRSTLFMALQSAFSLLLARYSGQDDVVVGTPIAGRDDTQQEDLIGCFVNTLVLRTQLDLQQSFVQLLQQCRAQLLDAYDHQGVPFEFLVEVLKPSRNLQYNPLFQIMFALHNQERTGVALGNATFAPVAQSGAATSKFDLSLDAVEGSDGISLVWRYATDLFRSETIASMDRCFRQLLEAIVAQPTAPVAHLPLLANTERTELLAVPAAASSLPSQHLDGLFLAQVQRHPGRLALAGEERTWCYAELDGAVSAVAAGLHSAGVGHADRVGVHLPSSDGLIIATLALFRLGAVYVPLDPDYPSSRLAYMVADSAMRLVIGDDDHLERSASLNIDVVGWQSLAVGIGQAYIGVATVKASDPAYIIYTSGSSGEPKGVVVSHANAVSYHAAAQTVYAVSEKDRVLQCASPSFDIFIEELSISLWSGASLHLAVGERHRRRSFWEDVQARGITLASLPTAYWHVLCTELFAHGPDPALPMPLRLVITGGERMTIEQLRQWRRSPSLASVRVLNTYGPTEATVIATHYDTAALADDADQIPIGQPLSNVHCVLLDTSGQPVPPGAVGELVLVGTAVAQGYLDKPKQTAASFGSFTDRDGNLHRCYRTGDLARRVVDGLLYFVGRADDQVKLSGYRIATGEIERQILAMDAVAMSAVVVKGSGTEARLLAALVPDPACPVQDAGTLVDRVHCHLKATLPAYMCPVAYAVLEALPLTPNGKLSVPRLLEHPFDPATDRMGAEPETETERILASLWAKRLQVDDALIGRQSSFFEIGGHSLLAIRLLNDIQRTFHKRVSVRQIFETPVLADLARRIDTQPEEATESIVSQPPTDRHTPASYAQRQLWFLEQVGKASGAYYISGVRRFDTLLDLRHVEQVLSWLVERHSALRTRFQERDNELWQYVDDAPSMVVEEIDALSVPASLRRTFLQQEIHARARQRFDLSAGLLLRVAAIIEEETTSLAWSVHHIAMDGWSVELFWREFELGLDRVRQNQPLLEAPAPLQYIDYSRWQIQQVQDGSWQPSLDYWQRTLAGLPLQHALQTDYPRPELQQFEGASYAWPLAGLLTAQLEALAARSGTSLFMVLHAAFAVLLARRTGHHDVVIGASASNRDRPEVADTVGLLANLVVLRLMVEPEHSFLQVLERVKLTNIEAMEHQQVPFQCLVEMLNPERSAAFNPVVQILIGIEQGSEVPMLAEPHFSEDEVAKFDLSLNIAVGTAGIALKLNFDRALFSARTMIGLAEQLTALLEDVVQRPAAAVAELCMLGADERTRLLRHAARASIAGSQPSDLLYVLDDARQLLPYGFEGELHVGGPRAQHNDAAVALAGDPAQPVLPTGQRVRFDHDGRLVASDSVSRHYWTRLLHGAAPRHGLPLNDSATALHDLAGDILEWTLPADRVPWGSDAGDRRSHAVAGFALLLSRYAAEPDVLLAMRDAQHGSSALAQLGNPACSTLLRLHCPAASNLGEWLAKVRQACAEAWYHRACATALLAGATTASSTVQRSLVQLLLLLDAPALSADGRVQDGMDLVLSVQQEPHGMHLAIGYRQSLFPRWLIEQMAQDLTAIFEQLAAGRVGQLRDITLSSQAPEVPARVDADVGGACLHRLFEQQAARTPEHVAVAHAGQSLDYATVERRANQLAHALVDAGVQPGALVGVCLPRTPALVVSLLAILKAGAAYVPLDPDYPAERLRYIAGDAGVVLILQAPQTSQCLQGIDVPVLDVADPAAFADRPPHVPGVEVDPAQLAYLIYTSGTTGHPKGVMIEHRNASEMLAWAHEAYTPSQLAVVLASTSMCFDLSVYEMFAPLTCGGSCLLAGHILDVHQDAWVRNSGITLINTVPSAIVQLLESGAVPDSVQVINLAGEALLAQVVDRIHAQTSVQSVYNLYGPSEDTTYSTWSLCPREAGRTPDIGIPIRGCQAFVVDGQGQVVPRGVIGELYLGGSGLSRGYWRRPELTAEKFVPGTCIGSRLPCLYRTGDLVRWNAEGKLEFIGRLDQQVKLNGFRIELGEIESALSASGVVKASGVLYFHDARGQRLVAFVQYLDGQGDQGPARARQYLREQLPAHMLPQEWVALDTLPLSANGKIDRNALRAGYAAKPAALEMGMAPAVDVRSSTTATEQWLAELWARILKLPRVGVQDNFFALGGRSLLALQVVNAVNQQFATRLSMVDVFKHPSVAELAQRIDAAAAQVLPVQSHEGMRLVQLRPASTTSGHDSPVLVLIHPINGDVGCYHSLLPHLDAGWEVVGVQATGAHALSLEALAARYVSLLEATCGRRRVHLAGYSLGGVIAFEMAVQLAEAARPVASLALIDAMLTHRLFATLDIDLAALMIVLQELGIDDERHAADLGALLRMEGAGRALEHTAELAGQAGILAQGTGGEALHGRFTLYRSHWKAGLDYTGRPYSGPVRFVGAAIDTPEWQDRGWETLADVEIAPALACNHFQILHEPHVARLGRWLQATIYQADALVPEGT